MVANTNIMVRNYLLYIRIIWYNIAIIDIILIRNIHTIYFFIAISCVYVNMYVCMYIQCKSMYIILHDDFTFVNIFWYYKKCKYLAFSFFNLWNYFKPGSRFVISRKLIQLQILFKKFLSKFDICIYRS